MVKMLSVTLFLMIVAIPNNVFIQVCGQRLLRQATNTLRKLINELPFDRELELSSSQNIVREGYPSEKHYTVTEDGYILTLQRIPCGQNCSFGRGRGQPVLLLSGLSSTSRIWTITGKDRGLPYILADAGYDVWLGESRGTDLSKAHLIYSTNPRSRFWDFSWHEIGVYDLPAFIDFIYYKKGIEGYVSHNPNNLLVISYSLGGTATFVLFSVRPEYNNKVAAVFNFAPIGYTKFLRSAIRAAAPIWLLPIEDIFFLLGISELGFDNKLLKSITQLACSTSPENKRRCVLFVMGLSGYSPEQFNDTLVPRVINLIPAGLSIKTLLHYWQQVYADGQFRFYDYGPQGNLDKYGQMEPPNYDLKKITVPMAYYYGTKDLLCTKEDSINFDAEITSSIGLYELPFGHFSFVWGNDAVHLLYRPVMEIMKKYE